MIKIPKQEEKRLIIMRLAAVGTGMIAHEVLPNLNKWGWELTAICSTPRSRGKAEELSRISSGSARVYTDFSAMLDAETVDAVYIAVPNYLHYEYAKKALENGKSVIIEKPIASNIREAAELAELAKQNRLFFYEAISTIHNPNHHKLRELLPRIGTVKLVTCNFSQYSSRYDAFLSGKLAPVFDVNQSGGVLMDLNLYNLHYVIGLFGMPSEAVYHANIDRGVDTSGVLDLDYGDFKAVLIAAKDCGAPCTYTIQGTKGYLFQNTPANVCGKVTIHLNDGTEEVFDLAPDNRLESEFRHFLHEMEAANLERCYQTLDHSLAVCRIQTEARLKAGIVFPADQ